MARTKRVTKYVSEDIMDENGLWLTSYAKAGDGFNYSCITRAGGVWTSVTGRSRIGGRHQEMFPAYEGAENLFENFQVFANWCQDQYGYRNKEINGKNWSLDKDILGPQLKQYSKETCCFVPYRLNNVLVIPNKSNGLPLGVTKTRDKTYRALCRDGEGGRKSLGCFKTKEEAHKAWQWEKSIQIENAISEYTINTGFRTDVAEALMKRVWDLRLSYSNNIETKLL